jgi:hypothetical protein
LRIVPIHLFQPKLTLMPDYCYSDRLQTGYETHFLQPKAFWCYLLQ